MRSTCLVLAAFALLATDGLAAPKSKTKAKAKPTATATAAPTPEPTPTPVEEGWEEAPVEGDSAEGEVAIPADLPAQRGTVAAPDSAVYASPAKTARVKITLLPGTFVEAFAPSPDGAFVQVRVTEDGTTYEGWMRKADLRSISRYGFTWERKTK